MFLTRIFVLAFAFGLAACGNCEFVIEDEGYARHGDSSKRLDGKRKWRGMTIFYNEKQRQMALGDGLHRKSGIPSEQIADVFIFFV